MALILCSLSAFSAQPKRSARFHQNTLPRPASALVDVNDRVFPDIVAGGGWETIFTFVNMSTAPSQFTLTFYDGNGNPVDMPLLNYDGSVSRYASVDFALDGNTSSELVAVNVDNDAISVWSYLSFTSGSSAVAGMAVVRSLDSKGNVFSESTESLANTRDYDFFAPYDNLDGVTTSLIVINPGNSRTANIRLSAQDANGGEIVGDRFQLAPGARVIIELPSTYPALADSSGKLRVTADINNLSAICFRVSPSGTVAYSPIFNWSGMFQ
jgi:hypothetical protein